jgi:hypothetical protein
MITKRVVRQKKAPPLPKAEKTEPKHEVFVVDSIAEVAQEMMRRAERPFHQLRKSELSRIHGIRETDIFVDPKNGVELYRTVAGGWVTNPKYRGVE